MTRLKMAMRVAAAVSTILVLALGCSSGSESQQPSTVAANTSPTSPATQAQVLAAVKKAQTATNLPASISPS
jgi:hypothetical protein